MEQLTPRHAPYARCVELLFSQMEDQGSNLLSQPLPPLLGAARTAARLPRDWPSQPPALEGPEDVRAVQEWFLSERKRLEEYTEHQFAAVQQQHYEVLSRHYQTEAYLAGRSQEVNRELQLLAAQAEAMKERARGLAEWEAALAGQTERLTRLQEEHVAARQAGGDAAPAERERLAALEALRAAMSHHQLSEEAARTQFEAVRSLLQERQAVWEKRQAEILARQEQVEKRCRELERAEGAMARRIAEIDELEDRLLRSLDEEEARHRSPGQRPVAGATLRPPRHSGTPGASTGKR
jgi:hypothetical protein